MKLHKIQQQIASSLARFKIVRAGRKGGKTKLEVETLCFKATASVKRLKLLKTKFDTGRKVLYIAPTQNQARTIIWEALKKRLAGVGKPNEQRMDMRVQNEDGEETIIMVGGYENRENYRGLTDVIHITFDEVDTFKEFFFYWKEIFRPMFIDTGGTADFVGTPKKENPNLRRLEREADFKGAYQTFHFTSHDNPFLPVEELESLKKEYEGDMTSYRQEILAEYIENAGALFKYDALVDIFSNAVTKDNQKYMTVDIADDGSDKTIFSLWEGLEEVVREKYSDMNTDGIINKTRELAAQYQIPFTNIAVDAIGVGAGVASSRLLDGIIGFKSSYSPIKTDIDIVRLPNMGYTKDAPLVSDYKNLRSQCLFVLADHVNNHKIASRVQDVRLKDVIIEELSNYQDASTGDGKRMATPKEKVKETLGRSPDDSDTWIMRMYFVVVGKMSPNQGEAATQVVNTQKMQFMRNRANVNSSK